MDPPPTPPPPPYSFSGRSIISPRTWLPGASRSNTKTDSGPHPNQNISISAQEEKIGPLGLTTLFTPQHGSTEADIIFVHGLGGGSRKTWTKSGTSSLYWPKEWLPGEEACRNVRIHSFGYDSNWGRKSVLGIHDFANALLNSIQDCPDIPGGTTTPIVLVGHSMGGLVLKRAYLLAVRKREYASLASRIQAILFLATPHRGSDCAQVLSSLLTLMGGKRPYVDEINRDSQALNSINDEFPEASQNLLLYSFYETEPTSFGLKKALIVGRDLATMGYANERRAYLNADHRNVCKFDSRSDPNYITIRNALSSVLHILRQRSKAAAREASKERRRQLNVLLGISHGPENDFIRADSHRMDGSVEWLIQKENFQEWIHYTNPPIYSITAQPATGKTVLSGRVIAYLRHLKKKCSFYFFQYRTKNQAASFLLSMAWQMADSEESILDACLQIIGEDDLMKTDYRTIWRKLFLDGIFKVTSEYIHYWVIDALDECLSESEIVELLMKAAEVSSIHIIVTSRNRFELRQKLGKSGVSVLFESILEQDSKADITMYLHANMEVLPAAGEKDQESIVNQILEKSSGCFLWVSIVVQELRTAYTSTDKQMILDEVPTDMNDLYSRILETMSKATYRYGKELAKAILTWTVCSTRPLRVEELHEALQLDLEVSVDGLEDSIRSYCGQLVNIDKSGYVQMTHLTARQFLVSSSKPSEFLIKEVTGHRRLLMTALRYLNPGTSKAQRRRKSSLYGIFGEDSPFVNYASNSLCEHIKYASCTDRDLLVELAQFFRSPNVLHWIEYIAKYSDQQRLVDTGKSLGTFLQESPDQTSSSSADVVLLSSWAADLVRLVMQFGKNLEAYPESIHNLIAPFCPSATSLRKQFGSSARSIRVRGLRAETWDDCLATVVDTSEQYSSLACSETQFAVGCNSGNIFLFKHTTCQTIATLHHAEPVRILSYGGAKNILVSAGSKNVRVWDLNTHTQIHVFDAPEQCMAISLYEDDQFLLGALKNHSLQFWDPDTGQTLENAQWTRGLEAMTIRLHRRPTTAAFGVDCGILAVIYKGQDILLWSFEDDKLVALYSRESGVIAESLGRPYGSSGVRCLVFGNAGSGHLLACAYTDGELVLFNTSMGEVQQRIVAFAHVLACSADGRMLASADPAGTIQLFEFETLHLIYRIRSVEPGLQGLSFSPDGLRLLDIRGSRCRVWDLSDLVGTEAKHKPGSLPGDTKIAGGTAPEASDIGVLITSLACDDSGEAFFVGKEDGSVHVYAIDSGLAVSNLLSHARGVSIVSLCFEERSRSLVSVDSSSRTMIHKLRGQGTSISVDQILFNDQANVAVGQVVCRPGLQHILICSAQSDMLWAVSEHEGTSLLASTFYQDREPYRWTNHPQNDNHLILITHHTAHIFDWSTLQRLTSERGIELQGKIIPGLSIQSITPSFDGTALATMFTEPNQPDSKLKLVLWSTSDFTPSSSTAVPVPKFCALCDDAEVILGNTNAIRGSLQRLVFLHGSQWVCTVDVNTAEKNQFVKHFFFPADWLSTKKDMDLSIKVTKCGNILLVKGTEVAVVCRGLLTPGLVEAGGSSLGPSARGQSLARRVRKTSTPLTT